MRTVGIRREPQITGHASGDALITGARFSESLSRLAPSTFIPKGVYRFKSHEAANKHQQDCLARGWRYWQRDDFASESTSRPATLEDLKTLLSLLDAHGVDYLLIGGYA